MKNLVVVNRSGKELPIPELRKMIPFNGKQCLLPEPLVKKYRHFLEVIPIELIERIKYLENQLKNVKTDITKNEVNFLKKQLDLNEKIITSVVESRRKTRFDFLYSFHFNKDVDSAIERLRCSIKSIIDQNVNVCVSNTSELDIEDKISDLGNINYIHRPVLINPYCKSKTINLGVKELVKSSYFFISDIDLIYPPDFIKIIKKYLFLKNPVRVVFYNYNLGSECGNVDNYKKCEEMFKKYPDKSRTQLGIAPGNGMINLKSFKSIKGFDESFIGYGWEDADFNKKVSKVCEYIEDDNPALRTYHLYHKNGS